MTCGLQRLAKIRKKIITAQPTIFIKGNVIIVSHRANTIKRDATPEEIQNLARGVMRALEDQFVDYGAYI